MKIELLHEWLGNRKRAVLDLTDRAARDLIDRKTAKPYKAPRKR